MRHPRVLVALALPILIVTLGAAPVGGASSAFELTFTRVVGDRYSVWVASADGFAARKLFEPAEGGALSSDGQWLTYSRLREGRYGAQFAGRYVVNLAGGKSRRLDGPTASPGSCESALPGPHEKTRTS
jgi:hypothetical protein